MLLTAGTRLGPYEVVEPLGAGGMGEVWKARDTRLDRSVALKVSKTEFSERFEREARAIAALNHPNICTLYDVGPNYLVMELVEGETLAARLKRGKLSIEQTIRYGIQIAAALAAAHAKGIVHRDLKPANVMIAKDGAKVLVFGLARSAQDQTLTLADGILGTPAYMAPEQQLGRTCDARTDIHALGLVLCEMATAKRVSPGTPPQPDSLPETLGHVVARCLAPDPDDRWQNARDVRFELEWAALAASRPAASARVSPGWPVLAGLALIALAATAFVHFREARPAARVVRSTILPPEKTSFAFAANFGPMALSPDGRRMVFAATAPDGTSQLWIRPLDTATAQPLQGTGGGMFPFWSPDSLWVAFFADGKLKKIDTRGGRPIALTEASSGQGGSWSPKGMIVFAPTVFAPLLKVSQDGGSTRLAIAADMAGHGFPWFLPDGEHFLFASWGGSGRVSLRAGSLGSIESKIVGEADSNAIYSDGRLLFLREGSLMAQPFDSKSLRGQGEAVPIAEGVQSFLDLVTFGAFSASAEGLLAYQTGMGVGLRQLTWFDRQGTRLTTLGDSRAFFSIEFSPDRRKLAASAPDALGNYDLWMFDVARGLPARFTSDPAGEYYAVWSPDGQSVIFNSTRKGHYDLYRKAANGAGAEELLYADNTDKVPNSWSPDGKFLLYFTGGGARHSMWVLPITPGQPGAGLKATPFLKTGFNETYGQFSPDGRWVAYGSDESGRYEIYVAPFSRPTEKHQISPNGGEIARWRRDGKEIFYIAPGGKLMGAEIRISGAAVEVGAVRALFGGIPTSMSGWLYDLSADGQRILAAIHAEGQKAAEPVTLVQNWTATLK